jgi:hypothetical protein
MGARKQGGLHTHTKEPLHSGLAAIISGTARGMQAAPHTARRPSVRGDHVN